MSLVRLAAGAVAASTIAGSALAADLAATPYPAPAPVFSWTGFYVGIDGAAA